MTHTWNPDRYLTYADERGRPFVELVTRIRAEAPASVVDLGCGPGNMTRLLAERWPEARIGGIDSSPEMIEKAQGESGLVDFSVGDLRDWAANAYPVDVVISNATLQWVPNHLELLPALVERVNPGLVRLPGPREFRRAKSHHLSRSRGRTAVRRTDCRRRGA